MNYRDKLIQDLVKIGCTLNTAYIADYIIARDKERDARILGPLKELIEDGKIWYLTTSHEMLIAIEQTIKNSQE